MAVYISKVTMAHAIAVLANRHSTCSIAAVMDPDEYNLNLSLCLAALAAACQQADAAAAARPARDVTAPPSSATPLHFRCPLCGKAFASYQALGGHKASHRKPPAAYGGATPLSRQKEAAEALASGSGGTGRHVCTVCHRGFDTGQALGGHKRFHYLHGPSVSASLPSAAASSAGGGFDLNLAPVEPEIGFPGVRQRGEDDEVQSPLPLSAKKPRRPAKSNSA